MSVHFCIPSARPPAEANACLRKWRERGYRVAVQRDPGQADGIEADYVAERPYTGYAEAVNWLARTVLAEHPDCQIIVTGGDDIDPDPRHDPAVLEREFLEHFAGSFGVMQPVGGEPWMVDASGRGCAERVAGSPWMGREWCERANQGRGPLWPDFFHFYEDEFLQETATLLGVFWQRKDMEQFHAHWLRLGQKRPPHLDRAQTDWANAKALFDQLKAAGFPGHEPLPTLVTA